MRPFALEKLIVVINEMTIKPPERFHLGYSDDSFGVTFQGKVISGTLSTDHCEVYELRAVKNYPKRRKGRRTFSCKSV